MAVPDRPEPVPLAVPGAKAPGRAGAGAGDDGLECGFADRDAAKRLHRLLHDLPEPYKEVFSLRTFGELPFAQIGELFDKTESWARVTYFRARQKLKEGFDGPAGP